MIAVRVRERPRRPFTEGHRRHNTQHCANTIAACLLRKLHVPSSRALGRCLEQVSARGESNARSGNSLLRRNNVDLYLSGHDHDLEHLEFKGHPTSFVISGGGTELVGWTTPSQECGPWGLRAPGFTDLQISKEEVVIRHVGKDATVLYEFRKTANVIDCS
jgi:hypothetical protein